MGAAAAAAAAVAYVDVVAVAVGGAVKTASAAAATGTGSELAPADSTVVAVEDVVAEGPGSAGSKLSEAEVGLDCSVAAVAAVVPADMNTGAAAAAGRDSCASYFGVAVVGDMPPAAVPVAGVAFVCVNSGDPHGTQPAVGLGTAANRPLAWLEGAV